jgi:hypothetical protein
MYIFKEKKNIFLALLCLALSVDVKYISLILVPFLIGLWLKDKRIKDRILKGFLYGIIFVFILILMYIPAFESIKDAINSVFAQQGKCKDSIYAFLSVYLKNLPNAVSFCFSFAIYAFLYLYFVWLVICIKNGENKFAVSNKIYNILLIIIFALLTNLCSWYLLWLFIPMFWSKPKYIKRSIALMFFYELSYVPLFYLHEDLVEANSLVIIFLAIAMLIRALFLKVYKLDLKRLERR